MHALPANKKEEKQREMLLSSFYLSKVVHEVGHNNEK